MAKYTGPVCRLCRREGEKLFLKGERCFTAKCGYEKRSYAPGVHGKSGSRGRGGANRESDFAKQLRAKQRARRVYGTLERQFRGYYDAARKTSGLTGLNLLRLLESRLDNVVYRMGFAASRSQARQLVSHGHFSVNGRRTDVPSMTIKPGDEITVREGSRKVSYFKELAEVAQKRVFPAWINRDLTSLSANVLRMPERAEIDGNLNEQLIVEYYSRR